MIVSEAILILDYQFEKLCQAKWGEEWRLKIVFILLLIRKKLACQGSDARRGRERGLKNVEMVKVHSSGEAN